VQVLLDLIEEELPIVSKGWKAVGTQFRDWAVVAKYPARTDWSLELKYKQVNFTSVETQGAVAYSLLVACENEEANWRCRVPSRGPPVELGKFDPPYGMRLTAALYYGATRGQPSR